MTDSASPSDLALANENRQLLSYVQNLVRTSEGALSVAARTSSVDMPRHPERDTSGRIATPPLAVTLTRVPELLRRSVQTVAPAPEARVAITDRWEGVVTKIEEDVFEGEFRPVGRPELRLHATFIMSEVDPDEAELVRLGALFFVVASQIRVSARRWQSSSSIRFRRIPAITNSEIDNAFDRARRLRRVMGLTD